MQTKMQEEKVQETQPRAVRNDCQFPMQKVRAIGLLNKSTLQSQITRKLLTAREMRLALHQTELANTK